MKNSYWILAAVNLMLINNIQAQQIGDLDTSFNGTGKVITDFAAANDGAQSVAIQSDGKAVVVGYSSVGNNSRFALSRYNTNGTLDTSFGGTGKVITDFAPLYDYASSVAIQPDGKILTAGQKRTGSSGANALIRYNTNGTLDTTFGVGGKVETVVGVADAGISAFVFQPDGKIVAVGISTNSSFGRDFAVVRYNNDGSIDNAFGASGIAMIDFNVSYDFAFAVALQTDGKILVSGATGDDPFYDFGMLRLDTLGVLDTTFGTGGKVVTDFGTNEDWVNAMAVQTDGKIILAGYKGYPSDIAMSRYNDDGSIDSTFGIAGKVISSLTTEDQANAICLQPDGKIVIGGMSAVNTNRDFSILRYNTNGLLDTTFSGNGYISTDFGTTSDKANAIALQADGKIVAAGVAGLDFAVARYLISLTTGIIDFDNLSNSILIYPNPVLDEATLNYTLSKADNITINLIDVNGRILKNFITNEYREATSHNQLLSFPNNLAHGTYFIVISNSSKQFSVQVVK